LVNSNLLTIGSAPALDTNSTKVNFTGGGTLVQNGNVTVRNNAVNNGIALATLDLSGLSFFVCSNSGTLNIGGTGSEQRAAGQLLLASVSNNITVTTLNLQTTTGNGGNNGGGAHIRLGLGTNIINAGTINFVGGKAVNGTVTFQGATGGLRIRGANGNADDSSRANITICNRNAGGTGTLAGTADFTGGHVVDIKADTITVGRAGTNPTSGNQGGTGNLRFDAGMIDAVTLNMAINTVTFANTTANVVVGSGGSLVVSNLSLVNQTANTATGNLFIGGTVTCAGGITKTTLAGTGNITITNGTLTLASGKTVGDSGVPIDNFNLTTATLNLSVVNSAAIITAAALNLVDAANTVNIAGLPSIGAFPGQFPLATYTSFPGGGGLNLGTLPPGYTGYVSNDTVNTLWLVIATGPVAKPDLWGGGINNLWDTTTLNWTNSGVAVNYNDNDVVTFGDSAKTNIVNLTAARLPASLTVSNNGLNYTFTGVGSIGGPVTLIKQGSASLTLSETGGDNFSGGITVSGGTLILDNTNSTISGGLSVALGATAQIGSDSGNGGLPVGGVAVEGTLIFRRTNDLTVGTVISGAGSVVKSGSGRLTLLRPHSSRVTRSSTAARWP
jgi:autotransporter-associated beta strand protein